MSDIGVRSGKVRPGFYRCGSFCIHKAHNRWGVYEGPKYIKSFATLLDAYFWAKSELNRRESAQQKVAP